MVDSNTVLSTESSALTTEPPCLMHRLIPVTDQEELCGGSTECAVYSHLVGVSDVARPKRITVDRGIVGVDDQTNEASEGVDDQQTWDVEVHGSNIQHIQLYDKPWLSESVTNNLSCLNININPFLTTYYTVHRLVATGH